MPAQNKLQRPVHLIVLEYQYYSIVVALPISCGYGPTSGGHPLAEGGISQRRSRWWILGVWKTSHKIKVVLNVDSCLCHSLDLVKTNTAAITLTLHRLR